MKAKFLPLVAVVTLIGGCATPVQYFSSKPSSNQKLVAVPPQKTTFGSQEVRDGIHSEVLFEPTAGNTLFNGMAVFWIYTKNVDAPLFHFSVNDVRVVGTKGNPVEVLSLSQLVSKLQSNKSKQEWGYILVSSMLSGLAAAPYMTNQQVGTFSGYTSNGQYVQGSYVGTATNKTVEYLAQQENSARIGAYSGQMGSALAQAMTHVQRLTLSEYDLEKGMSAQGIVVVPLPRSLPNSYRFIVRTVAGTFEHTFEISRTK